MSNIASFCIFLFSHIFTTVPRISFLFIIIIIASQQAPFILISPVNISGILIETGIFCLNLIYKILLVRSEVAEAPWGVQKEKKKNRRAKEN